MSCPGFSDDMTMKAIGNSDQNRMAATATVFPEADGELV